METSQTYYWMKKRYKRVYTIQYIWVYGKYTFFWKTISSGVFLKRRARGLNIFLNSKASMNFNFLQHVCLLVFKKKKKLIMRHVKVKVAQSYSTLCDGMDYPVRGILQARILEWVVLPFSRGSSQPRDRTQVSPTAGGFFTHWATGSPRILEGIAYSFSSWSSQPRNQTGDYCIAYNSEKNTMK